MYAKMATLSKAINPVFNPISWFLDTYQYQYPIPNLDSIFRTTKPLNLILSVLRQILTHLCLGKVDALDSMGNIRMQGREFIIRYQDQ